MSRHHPTFPRSPKNVNARDVFELTSFYIPSRTIGLVLDSLDTPMIRILLAEDDDSLRAFLHRALERAGYRVRACADGDEAIDALNDGPYDLLLTDIVMPGADGIEVAREAAARDPSTRIMFITGFAAVALAATDRAPEGAKVLSKPVHLREIVAEVERMVMG